MRYIPDNEHVCMCYSRVVGVNELVLGAPCVPGGGGMVGGVNLGCPFTSAGESGMVEGFSVRSAGRHKQAHVLRTSSIVRR